MLRVIDKSTATGATESNAIGEAYAMQDTCNMVAIVGDWHKKLLALSAAGLDTAAICRHPSTILMVDKLVSLANHPNDSCVENAYRAHRELRETGRTNWSY